MSQTANLHIASNIALPSPRSMVAEIAPTEAQTAFVAESRREIREILFGSDSRFLIVLGPCSIHDPVAALDYADRLAALAPTWVSADRAAGARMAMAAGAGAIVMDDGLQNPTLEKSLSLLTIWISPVGSSRPLLRGALLKSSHSGSTRSSAGPLLRLWRNPVSASLTTAPTAGGWPGWQA